MRLRLLRLPFHPPLWFLLLLAAVLVALGTGWDASLRGRHEFRQEQTALSAFWIREHGPSLAYPLPLFGPPWSAPMEFPTYQTVVAGISSATGLGIESAGRLVSVAAFLAALPALAGLLAAAGFPPPARWPALAAVLLTPVYLFYSSAVLIESTALCLGLWYLFAQVRALERRRWGWLGLAVLCGALAAATKITTFALCALAAAGWVAVALVRTRRDPFRALAWKLFAGAAPAAIALVAGLLWVNFGDSVKAANPFSEFLVSHRLADWNFGSLAQRLDPQAWRTLGSQFAFSLCPPATLIAGAIALCCVARPYRLAALAGTALFLAGPLLFINLYVVHDYYAYASAWFLTGAIGLLLGGAALNPRVPRLLKIAVLALGFGGQLQGLRHSWGYYRFDQPPVPAMAAVVRATVPPEGVVVVANANWDPLLPYSMQRRAIMPPPALTNDTATLAVLAERMPAGAIKALVWHGDAPLPLDFARWAFGECNLSPTPVARAGAYILFLARDLVPAAARAIPALGLAEVDLTPPSPPIAPAESDLKTVAHPIGIASPLSQPVPRLARSLFGVRTAEAAGRPCIVADAPSQLVIDPPDGAREVALEFALADDCIKPGSISDGVEVVVSIISDAGHRQVLFRRRLDPVNRPSDRGIQKAIVPLPAEPAGALSLEVGIGPAGNLACDWFYWYGIAVR